MFRCAAPKRLEELNKDLKLNLNKPPIFSNLHILNNLDLK